MNQLYYNDIYNSDADNEESIEEMVNRMEELRDSLTMSFETFTTDKDSKTIIEYYSTLDDDSIGMVTIESPTIEFQFMMSEELNKIFKE